MSVEVLWKQNWDSTQMPEPTYQMQPCKPIQFRKTGRGRCAIILKDSLRLLSPTENEPSQAKDCVMRGLAFHKKPRHIPIVKC